MENSFIKPEQGKRLKECIKYRNKTQKWLSEAAHISQPTISDIINGKVRLTEQNVLLFSKVLDVRPEYLLLESDYMTEQDRISAICGNDIEINETCFSLIEALGYKIIDLEESSTGTYTSIHRDYKKVNILVDDTSDRILDRVKNTPPVRVYILKNPSGRKSYIEQEELLRIIKNISEYAKFQCETFFNKFNSSFMK